MVWLLPLMAFTTQKGSDWDSVSKRGSPFLSAQPSLPSGQVARRQFDHRSSQRPLS